MVTTNRLPAERMAARQGTNCSQETIFSRKLTGAFWLESRPIGQQKSRSGRPSFGFVLDISPPPVKPGKKDEQPRRGEHHARKEKEVAGPLKFH